MLSAFGRAAARKVCVAGSLPIRTAGRLTTPVIPTGYRVVAVFTRGFAAASAPKKTTTKAAATTTASKKKPAAKTPAKKTATKTTTKKRVVAKKAAKPKAKKAAKKPKTTKPKKKPLTDEQKAKLKLRALKERALLKEQPARLPVSSWNIFLSKNLKEVLGRDPKPEFGEAIRLLSAEHRALPAHEKEKLELESQKNKTANEINLKNWIDSRTAQEIREANTARILLKRRHDAPIRHPLPDSRYPKSRLTAYMAYVKSRYTTGEFEGLTGRDRLAKISADWKKLDDDERKPFEVISETDGARYRSEIAAYRETIQK